MGRNCSLTLFFYPWCIYIIVHSILNVKKIEQKKREDIQIIGKVYNYLLSFCIRRILLEFLIAMHKLYWYIQYVTIFIFLYYKSTKCFSKTSYILFKNSFYKWSFMNNIQEVSIGELRQLCAYNKNGYDSCIRYWSCHRFQT